MQQIQPPTFLGTTSIPVYWCRCCTRVVEKKDEVCSTCLEIERNQLPQGDKRIIYGILAGGVVIVVALAVAIQFFSQK
jgi:predicted nucleic acid-binding Zn ribbon protein